MVHGQEARELRKCIVYGNCHVWPIRKYLTSSSAFNELYEMIHVPPVHQCDPDTGLPDEVIRDCGLFIYQRVKDSFGPYLSTDYILSRLPEACIRISFGNAYFHALYPQHATDPSFPYADGNIIRWIEEGWSMERMLAAVADENFYSQEQVMSVLQDSLEELRKRDTGLDLPIADFIEQYYRDYPLFYTINHPTHHLIRYLAMHMLALLGLPPEEIAGIVWDEDFRDHTHPIYPSVIKHLQLNFVRRGDSFQLGNVPHTFEQYTEAFIVHRVQGDATGGAC